MFYIINKIETQSQVVENIQPFHFYTLKFTKTTKLDKNVLNA